MPYEKSNKEIQESKVKGFKMKGSPMKRNFGIGAESPMKQETTPTYTGANIKSSYDYKNLNESKIPSFRDFVSLEQQQAVADKVDKRRADEKKYKRDIEQEGLGRNIIGKLTGDVFGGKRAKERQKLISDIKSGKRGSLDDLDIANREFQEETLKDLDEPVEGSQRDKDLKAKKLEEDEIDNLNFLKNVSVNNKNLEIPEEDSPDGI
jgi:hypothetical protein